MRGKVNEAVVIGFQSDPEYIKRPLATLNSEAVSQCKTGDHVAAVVAFCKLFERAKRKNLIHPEMHVCYRYIAPHNVCSRISKYFVCWHMHCADALIHMHLGTERTQEDMQRACITHSCSATQA